VPQSSELPRVDPRYQKHCVPATIICPDNSRRDVSILRDTGALQSLVSRLTVNEHELSFTGEKWLIRGVTGDVIAVSHVEVTVDSSLRSGTYLCGLAKRYRIVSRQ